MMTTPYANDYSHRSHFRRNDYRRCGRFSANDYSHRSRFVLSTSLLSLLPATTDLDVDS